MIPLRTISWYFSTLHRHSPAVHNRCGNRHFGAGEQRFGTIGYGSHRRGSCRVDGFLFFYYLLYQGRGTQARGLQDRARHDRLATSERGGLPPLSNTTDCAQDESPHVSKSGGKPPHSKAKYVRTQQHLRRQLHRRAATRDPRQRRSGLCRSALQYRLRLRCLPRRARRRKNISTGRGSGSAACKRVLKPNGTFWLAIGDEYAAELKLIAQTRLRLHLPELGHLVLHLRRELRPRFQPLAHAPLPLCLRPADFTFNADDPAVRVPSARQLVYADTRANPKGRLPDNTWILRPQDLPDGVSARSRYLALPRVAGTFKEREGFHGCQMPEQLLGRIIRCCSNQGDVVLDPFGGSGTTLSCGEEAGAAVARLRAFERLRRANPGPPGTGRRGRPAGRFARPGNRPPADGPAATGPPPLSDS